MVMTRQHHKKVMHHDGIDDEVEDVTSYLSTSTTPSFLSRLYGSVVAIEEKTSPGSYLLSPFRTGRMPARVICNWGRSEDPACRHLKYIL